VLDEFQIRGLFINWWNENKFELRTIKESGWTQSLLSNFDFADNDNKAVETTLEKAKYFFKDAFEKEISEIEILEGKERELSAEVEEEPRAEELESEDEEGKAESRDKVLKSEINGIKNEIRQANKIIQLEYIRRLQKELCEKESELEKITSKKNALKQVQKEINQKNQQLVEKVPRAIDILTEDDAENMVMKKLEDSASEILKTYLIAQKQRIVAYFDSLWDKYATDLRTIEKERTQLGRELDEYLRKLGYEA